LHESTYHSNGWRGCIWRLG